YQRRGEQRAREHPAQQPGRQPRNQRQPRCGRRDQPGVGRPEPGQPSVLNRTDHPEPGRQQGRARRAQPQEARDQGSGDQPGAPLADHLGVPRRQRGRAADRQHPGQAHRGPVHRAPAQMRTSRTAAVSADPAARTVRRTTGKPKNAIRARSRQRSVLPTGPPCTRGSRAAAPASATHDGSVAASAAARTSGTGANARQPAIARSSAARSPPSLSTEPNGVARSPSRATPPSRLAQPSRAASSAARASAAPAVPPKAIPATVIAAGGTSASTRTRRTGASRSAYQDLKPYRPYRPCRPFTGSLAGASPARRRNRAGPRPPRRLPPASRPTWAGTSS